MNLPWEEETPLAGQGAEPHAGNLISYRVRGLDKGNLALDRGSKAATDEGPLAALNVVQLD